MVNEKARRAASSPAARAKAVATMKRRRAEKLKAQVEGSVERSLDDIPDGLVKARKAWKKKPKPNNNVELARTLLRTALALLEG